MGRLFFLAVFSGTSVAALFRPWVGVVMAYLVAILAPQQVWWWNFEGIRPAAWIMIPTIVGLFVALIRRAEHASGVFSQQTVSLLIMFGAVAGSYVLGPYVGLVDPGASLSPVYMTTTLFKIVVLYLLGVVCINSELRLKFLLSVIVLSAAYMIYWANDMYLSGQVRGRLSGPGIYSDENDFAMLFVVALPFVWYLSFAIQNRFLRVGMWLLIPLGWHAVFLAGSRGGLLALGVSTAILAWRSRSKILGAGLLVGLVIAFFWQGGSVMRDRATTIGEFQTESSASARLQAWAAAGGMISAHPLTGVGVGSFVVAFPNFSSERPRVAHNTFLQFAAESGVVAGGAFLALLGGSIVGTWKSGKRLRRDPSSSRNILYLTNEATLVALCGFGACSMFLTLQLFEVFYFLCLVASVTLALQSKKSLAVSG